MFPQLKRNTQHILVLAMIATTVVARPAHAQRIAGMSALAASAEQTPNPDKLDVTDLEKKYWAAKDTDFSVVQNRTYSKEHRPALSLQYGTLVNDPYNKGSNWSGSLSYYFSERYGVEANYTSTKSTDNSSVSAYKSQHGTLPDYNKIEGYYGAAFNWVPFYAKVSVLNSKIIYFDMAISPGIGVTSYEQQMDPAKGASVKKTAPTGTLDVTQMFFMGKHTAIRLDYKNRWFNEEVIAAGSGLTAAGTKLRTQLNNTSLLMVGVTLFW
jgi:outer membrane beta-barrel protein